MANLLFHIVFSIFQIKNDKRKKKQNKIDKHLAEPKNSIEKFNNESKKMEKIWMSY